MAIESSRRYKEALLNETREELQKSDAKASILLAASGIAASALLTALGSGTWSPSRLRHGDARLLIWLAMFTALGGICLLGMAVKPRLRAKAMGREKLHYFGNVYGFWPLASDVFRRKSKVEFGREAFEEALAMASTEANYDDRLTDQIWFLGFIAFRKYRLITISLWTFGVAIAMSLLSLVLEMN